MIGKVGITVSPANPERVWAIVEAEDGGVFRSDNGGQTWTRVNEERRLRQRAWYYTRIYADPKNADTVYVLNVQLLQIERRWPHLQHHLAFRTATITISGSLPTIRTG